VAEETPLPLQSATPKSHGSPSVVQEEEKAAETPNENQTLAKPATNASSTDNTANR
jgi:hypothetical protein